MLIIKNRMKELRAKRHIKQSDLAVELGVCRETIYRLENNKYENPSFKLIYQIADFFGEPVEKIFTYVEEGQKPEWPKTEKN